MNCEVAFAAEGGAEVTKPVLLIEAADPEVPLHSAAKIPTIEAYLNQLALSCEEGARDPRVRGPLLRLLLIAPSTLSQLRREARRIAARVRSICARRAALPQSPSLESDYKPPPARTEDRLDAEKPKNQGKNVSRFSHGFFFAPLLDV